MSKSTEITAAEEQEIFKGKEVLAAKQAVLTQSGQATAFNYMKQISEIAELKVIGSIKESKEYKGLLYFDENGKQKQVSTFEEFCIHFQGFTAKTINERLANLNILGEQFLERSQQLGLGYRDLRALRQLPEDEQTLVIESEAVETGDKEAIKDLIADLKAQHKKELDTEKKKAKEIDDQRQVAVRMRDDYQMKAMDYQNELESTKFKADAWVDQTKHLLFEATKYESNAVESLSRLMALREHFLDDDNLSPQVTEYLAAGLLHSFKTLAEDFAQAWLETSNMLEGYLPKMRPSLDVLQELNDSAMSNEE
ncbi:hypothetical protein H5200_12175 [Pseudoalteromonas sp. SG43-7]|uniref:hypothetical protein n=1 Tax=Pseudoalteromonas sp. SG43-7 TaxID=2760966 RepID=UPI001603E8A9|nr:hypothetical protein [Pseudoalteromonas sp. SG43-7]MBB1422677.1 hypothetical protein [Pseudoalteromonas sp. SG43-7]